MIGMLIVVRSKHSSDNEQPTYVIAERANSCSGGIWGQKEYWQKLDYKFEIIKRKFILQLDAYLTGRLWNLDLPSLSTGLSGEMLYTTLDFAFLYNEKWLHLPQILLLA